MRKFVGVKFGNGIEMEELQGLAWQRAKGTITPWDFVDCIIVVVKKII